MFFFFVILCLFLCVRQLDPSIVDVRALVADAARRDDLSALRVNQFAHELPESIAAARSSVPFAHRVFQEVGCPDYDDDDVVSMVLMAYEDYAKDPQHRKVNADPKFMLRNLSLAQLEAIGRRLPDIRTTNAYSSRYLAILAEHHGLNEDYDPVKTRAYLSAVETYLGHCPTFLGLRLTVLFYRVRS